MGGESSEGEPLEIVVRAYSPRYAAAVSRLLGIEGGFSNDPVDHGGTTKFGISLRFLKAEGKIDLDGNGHDYFDLNVDGDIDGADIRLLTKANAIYLYHRCFWQRFDCESFPAPIGEMLFDQAVNDGGVAAKKLLQRAINACTAHIPLIERLQVDGVLGQKTLAAMKAVLDHPGLGMPALAQAYRDAAAARYRAIAAADPSQVKYLNGWLARAKALGTDA